MQSSKWNIIWLAPWLLLTWGLCEILVWLPLLILGTVIVPIQLLLMDPNKYIKESLINKGMPIYVFPYKWMDELFGNHEDGLAPEWWWEKKGKDKSFWYVAITWFYRNSIRNMSFWPIVGTLPIINKIEWIGSDAYPNPVGKTCFIVWMGYYSGFLIQTKNNNGLWIGWKIYPKDRFGIADYRHYGIGPDTQRLH